MAADDVKGFARFKFEAGEKLDAAGFRFKVVFFTFLVFMTSAIFLAGSATKFSNAFTYLLASGMSAAHRPDLTMYFKTPDGGRQAFQVGQFDQVPALLDGVSHVKKIGLIGGSVSLILAFITLLAVTHFFRRYRSSKKHKKTHIRGAKLVDAETLADVVDERGETTPYLIARVPIPSSIIMQHLYLSGDTGQGKSQLMMDLLTVFRQQGKKAFLLDKNGELMSHFYRPDIDHVLSPFDGRSWNWTPYCEGRDEVDFERLAKSFIPTSNGSGDKDHWPESAVTVFTALLYQLTQQPDFQGTHDELLASFVESRKVVEKDLLGRDQIVVKQRIYDLLKGTLASMSINPDAPEHASSVIGTITPKIRSMRYMRGLESKRLFSIRDWVKNDDDKGWLFIRVTEEQLDSVRPLITAWLDTAIRAMLTRDKTRDVRIVGCLDELQSLDKINSLKKALNEGRKHGLFTLLGFTSVNELFEIYGRDSATAMLAQCNTKVVFKTDEPTAARWNAELLGMEEVIQESENMHYGEKDSKGVNEQRDSHRYVVMPSEVQTLPQLTAYVKFSGDWPAAKVHTQYTERPVIAPLSVKRDMPPPLVVPDATTNPAPARPEPEPVPRAAMRKNEPMI